MKVVLRNILAIVVGFLVGCTVNMGLILVSGELIPPPEGADVTTMEGLKESMHLFQPQHFLFPFLAHALGTLVGAFVAAKIAARWKIVFALVIGLFFLGGGVTMVLQIPSPLWFNVLDLVGAYIPMALLGWLLAGRTGSKPAEQHESTDERFAESENIE